MDMKRLLALWGTLVIVVFTGAAVYVLAAYMAYIVVGGFVLVALTSTPFLVQSWHLRHLPLKQHYTEEARLAHEQEMDRERLAMEREKHTQELQIQQRRFELETHVMLTRVPPDAKGYYPYLAQPDGTLQHLPNPHMHVKQIAAPPATKVTEEEDSSEDEASVPRLLPALVRYDDIRAQVPRGHTLLGIGTNGLETRKFSVLSTCWIVGGSKTGKTNTVALKVEEAYNLGCYFFVIDPHRYKEDSLYNSIRAYRSRFLKPGVATTPEEIRDVLKAFLTEAQARLNGTSKNRTPITLLMDEVGHVCDIVGLEGEELEIAQEIVALLKKISRMCGQELRGFNMFGWFISQTATGLAWLRKNAMTVIAHKVLMMSERKLACNEDMQIARSMDTWPVGRIMVYGLDFPDGSMILQQPVVTPRIVDADPPTSFTPGASSVNDEGTSGNEREIASQAVPLHIVRSMESPVTVYETGEGGAEKKIDTSKVGDETRAIIVRLYQAKPPMAIGKIADAVGLNGRKYPIFQEVCKELGIETKKKAEA
jgi:hypothetical protein